MGRLVSVLLAVLLVASVADAKTPLRKCRKACKPLVSSVCPPKGKALRKCRTPIIRECRREGLSACAFGLPTGGPGDGTSTPTTTSSSTTTTVPSSATTTTTTVGVPTTTTTLPSSNVPRVDGGWVFDGVLMQAGCDLDGDIVADLVVQQDGAALTGTIGEHTAAGAVDGEGWTFSWEGIAPSDATCTRHFTVYASGYSSPAEARATASASCSGDGSTCQARFTGSVTRVP